MKALAHSIGSSHWQQQCEKSCSGKNKSDYNKPSKTNDKGKKPDSSNLSKLDCQSCGVQAECRGSECRSVGRTDAGVKDAA